MPTCLNGDKLTLPERQKRQHPTVKSELYKQINSKPNASILQTPELINRKILAQDM